MTTLVMTITIGEEYQRLAVLTHPTLRAYARRIGAAFLSIEHQEIATTTPHWEKCQLATLLERYDRVLYLDTDIIVRDDCPNLFDLVPSDHLGMFNEAPFTVRSRELMIDVCRAYGRTLPGWDGRYFNTGVMVVSQGHQDLFVKPDRELCNFYEQTYLNMQIAALRPLMYELPYQFNRMTCMDAWTGEHRLASYIVHYAGAPNTRMLEPLIREDRDKWSATGPEYVFQRHIHIQVTGGLGDQVNAEPAIRFLQERIYPDASLVITTHFPAIFAHLGVPVYLHGTWRPEPDTPYYTAKTLPGPDTVNWAVLSNLLCHTVDYCSSALLRRLLPIHEKRARLRPTQQDCKSLVTTIPHPETTVVVHAGRHWRTKTFPVTWWQEVVDGLVARAIPVGLIGQDNDTPDDTRGVVPVVSRPGCCDVRNRLSLQQLIALLSVAPVLVSNDSAPVHIAGAFDNWIVLIPSCKHPEHVLPHRYGSVFWKTRALCKRLLLDDVSSRPTDVHGVSAEFEVPDWSPYLPDSAEVVKTVLDVYGRRDAD